MKEEVHFINVDVEIFADFNLKPVLKKLKPHVIKMYCGEAGEEYLLALELNRTKCPVSLTFRIFSQLFSNSFSRCILQEA